MRVIVLSTGEEVKVSDLFAEGAAPEGNPSYDGEPVRGVSRARQADAWARLCESGDLQRRVREQAHAS